MHVYKLGGQVQCKQEFRGMLPAFLASTFKEKSCLKEILHRDSVSTSIPAHISHIHKYIELN